MRRERACAGTKNAATSLAACDSIATITFRALRRLGGSTSLFSPTLSLCPPRADIHVFAIGPTNVTRVFAKDARRASHRLCGTLPSDAPSHICTSRNASCQTRTCTAVERRERTIGNGVTSRTRWNGIKRSPRPRCIAAKFYFRTGKTLSRRIPSHRSTYEIGRAHV